MTATPPAFPPLPDLRQLLVLVMERMSEFVDVERSTLFLWDEESRELWTPVAQGLGSDEIRIPAGTGIAGHVMATGETVQLDDPYADGRFNPEVDRRTGFRTRDLHCRPLMTPGGRRIGVVQLLNRRGGAFDGRRQRLLDALCSQAAIAIENAQLFLKLSKVHDSERRLHEQLSAKHGELQRAYVRLEQAAIAETRLAHRVRRIRTGAAVGVAVVFLGAGLFAWRGGLGTAAARRGPDPRAAAAPAWQAVEPRSLRSMLTLVGNVEPREIRNLTVPLRGRVAEKHFAYGEPVAAGQLLARIDTTETLVDLRNARATLYRAEAELRRLEGWSDQPEVARARRARDRALLNHEGHARNLREMEHLATLGIIAQSSLESARQQFATQEADYRAAEEDLANVLGQATPERVTLARYEVENADLRVTDLERRIAGAELHAPFDGIVILPHARPSASRPRDHDGYYEVGSSIGQNDILLAVGNLEGITVKTRADEVDILQLRHGQPVRITGDAFGGEVVEGAIAYLSSQAIVGSGRPYFEVVVRSVPLTPAQRTAVRLGVTARLEITTRAAEDALSVPLAAVGREGAGHYVWRRDAAGRPERAAVEIGLTTPVWAEVIRGLGAGDMVASRAAEVVP